MRVEDTPVLIVGGGIVGLSASLFLARHGVDSLLLERRAVPSTHPRSRGLNGRTMELMREVGLEDAVRHAGAPLAPAIGWFEGTSLAEVVGPQPRRDADAPSPFNAAGFGAIGPAPGSRGTQDRVEPVLLAAAQERAGVRFGATVISLADQGDHVLATVEAGDDTYQVRARYAIAADGANSPVRKALGVPTTGRGLIARFMNVLFHADLADYVRDREFSAVVIDRPEVRGMVLSIDNASRWVFHIRYDDEPPTLERCEELTRLALGLPDVRVDVERMSPWECAERVAERFRHGRVFLAGDAAHQMPPWGGQGANTGVADVHNLAWKLAMVLDGRADERLLDTYEPERLPVARVAARESADASDERGLVGARTGLPMAGMKDRWARILGYGFQYASDAVRPDGSPALGPTELGLDGRPGTRAPHAWVGEHRSTLDVVGPGYAVLAGEQGEAWCEAARSPGLAAYRVGPHGDLVDAEDGWREAAGITPRGMLLVRPDGVVAWRSAGMAADPAAELAATLPSPPIASSRGF